MIPFFKHLFHALLHDELAVRRWGRAFLAVVAGGAIQVAGVGWDVASLWSLRECVGRLALACVLGAALAITAGEKNVRSPSDPQEPSA